MDGIVPSFRRVPILSSLTQATRLEIERASEEQLFPRRHVIFKAGQKCDFVHVLVSGRVKLLRTSATGRELTLALLNPNDIFGETSLLETDATYCLTAEVLEEAVVSLVDRKTLSAAVIDSSPALRAYVSLQENRRELAESRLAEQVFYDVPRRIARLIGELAVQHGRASKGGVLIRVRLTHHDIANLVGSTRETTTLILNDFRRRGLIDFSGRRIIVCNMDKLAALA